MSVVTKTLKDDVFGGLASMLVAFPSAVAFGLLVFGGLGAEFKGPGALAGMIGAMAVGIIAPIFGGAPRLVSAPCAPAAAVLGAFVMQQAKVFPESIFLLVSLTALFCGLIQIAFGSLGGGKVIKYIPFPVVAGYLSGVGCLIMLGQAPKFLGLAKEVKLWPGIVSPDTWNTPAIITGFAAMLAMIFAARITRAVPGPIIALVAGGATYFALSRVMPSLATLTDNPLVIGEMPAASLGDLFHGIVSRFTAAGNLSPAALNATIMPAATLAVLLSIDTLKTCVIVDALTQSRHESNRELIAQGLANTATALLGGLPGAGTMGATLVNISSGGHTRLSGVFQGVFSGAAFLLLAGLVAWIPVSALAGILIVVAFRMIDRKSFSLLRKRSTMLDFGVILAVVVTAVGANLIAAAGVGLAFAIVLFIRDQIRSSVVRRMAFLHQISSKRRRVPSEIDILKVHGHEAVLFELQGSLFFGTTDQLSSVIDPHLAKVKHVILDMKRVQSVDYTAAHLIELLESRIRQKGGSLALSQIPASLPTGQNLRQYFDHVGLTHKGHEIKIFPTFDDALEWAEDEILRDYLGERSRGDTVIPLGDTELFRGLPDDAMRLIESCTRTLDLAVGDKAFKVGDPSDELFIIRKGDIRIEFPMKGRDPFYVASFGPGDFFGDMAFLDQGQRSADAVAREACVISVLSRRDMERLVYERPDIRGMIFERLARVLVIRLRHADAELRALAEA